MEQKGCSVQGYNDFGGDETGGYRDDSHSPGDRSNSQLARAGTVRKNINRYYSHHFKEKSHYTQRCPHFRGLEVPAPLMPSLIDTETSSALKKVVQESGFGKEQFNRVQKIILRTLE